MALLPINTKIRGPAPISGESLQIRHEQVLTYETADPNEPDIIEESLDLYVSVV
jgi:hypothetical protein